MAVLRALKGVNPGQLFTLKDDRTVLGRHPDCDLVLEVGAVSRQHAQIVHEGDDWFIEDLRSRNGTFLNDTQVSGLQRIDENDVLKICDLEFVFHRGSAAGRQTVAYDDSTESGAMLVDDERDTGSTIMSKLDVSSGREGLRVTVNAEAKLKAVLEIGQNLGRAVGLGEVLPKVLDSLFKIFLYADRGFVVLKDTKTGRLVPKAIKHRREEDAEQARISRTIVNTVIAAKQAILSADAAQDFDASTSIADIQIHSMMCAPLIASDGEVLGVLQIDTMDQRHRFTNDDLDVLASVACQAAVSVENAQLHEVAMAEQVMLHELELAHKVQRGFLPADPPLVEGYEFFDFYRPARQLGGDYFDYVKLPGGRLAVLLGDVSGKGVSAALFMAKLSSEARYSLVSEPNPTAAVEMLNKTFCQSNWEDRFITFMLNIVDPKTHEVTVVNAGHMPPLWRHAGGKVERAGQDEGGLPLGVYDEGEYESFTIKLEPGDSLTLYSDGIPDAMNEAEEFYSEDRLLDQMARPELDGVQTMGKTIIDDVERFAGAKKQTDDMCLTVYGRVRDS